MTETAVNTHMLFSVQCQLSTLHMASKLFIGEGGKKKSCMATDMHTDGSRHHGNPNSTLYSDPFTRTFWDRNKNWIKKKKGQLDLQYEKSHSPSAEWEFKCLSFGFGTSFVFALLLTGAGPRRSQTAALNIVSGGGAADWRPKPRSPETPQWNKPVTPSLCGHWPQG